MIRRNSLPAGRELHPWLLCFLLLGATAWSQAQSGTVTATGSVSVNGQRVAHSASIFSGERLETGSDGAASIVSDGTIASVAHNTKLTYGSNSIDLECGAVEVVTLDGFWVSVNGVKAVPASGGRVRFNASQSSGHVTISVLEGQLGVEQGGARQVLSGGESHNFNNRAHCGPLSGWVPAGIFGASTAPFLFPRDHEPISGLEPED